MAVDASVPSDFDQRVRAVTAFSRVEAATALAAANKRIANILKKSEADIAAADVRMELLTEPAERVLAERVAALREQIAPLVRRADYQGALMALADLRADVDRFFDEVMVMTDDIALRANRLGLVQGVLALFSSIADISRLRGAEQT
jgi:glycyl-tRNA synthetase beta chain